MSSRKMANAAPGSRGEATGNSGPYIGSLISLVSKSEIRYEGILYGVDTVESTIALAKVRSFGTENRSTNKPVARVNELFEYIIFKASDIKDLTVCEQPPARHQVYNDPAIVSVKQGGGRPSPTSKNNTMEFVPSQHYGGRPGGMPSRSTTPSTVGAAQSMYPFGAPGGGMRYGGSPEPLGYRRSLLDGMNMSQQQAMAHSRGGIPPPLMPPMYGNHHMMNHRMHSAYMSARGGYRNGNLQGQQYARRPPHMDDGPQPATAGAEKKPTHTYLDDYDFEAANEDYKEALQKMTDLSVKLDSDEGADVKAGDDDVDEKEVSCYDKKTSFFDNISTDAEQHDADAVATKRRESGERQPAGGRRLPYNPFFRNVNVETFGAAALRAHMNAWHYRNAQYQRRYSQYPMQPLMQEPSFNPYYEYMQQQHRPRSYYHHSRRNTVGSTTAAVKKAARAKENADAAKAKMPPMDNSAAMDNSADDSHECAALGV